MQPQLQKRTSLQERDAQEVLRRNEVESEDVLAIHCAAFEGETLSTEAASGATAAQTAADSPAAQCDQATIDRGTVLRTKRLYWIGRRSQDIFFSALALIVLSPFLLLVTLIVWADCPKASPIFSQERVGRDGKRFRFLKFRSMIPDAEKALDGLLEKNEMDGPVFKIKDDPRITRVGRIIRRTSIDELPQLLNILKGDMSIVGPRPALPREVEKYGEYERQRLFVTPGLTCYWQIQPHRNDLTFHEWMELDLKYVRERSFLTDWKIIFKTVGAVLGMNGE